jgi:hypothetical protein
MQKTLVPIEIQFKNEKKYEGQRFQYLIKVTPDQEFWSPIFNSVDDLDKWFERMFQPKETADIWEK